MTVLPSSLRRLRLSLLLFWIGACLLSGCSRGDGFERLSGSVTFEGKPLDEGAIQFFIPGEPPTPVAGAMIIGGKYEIPKEHGVKPGNYLVRISSTERVETPSAGGVAMSSFRTRERIPSKYNTESTLSVDVHAGERRPFDFNLE